MKKMNNLNFYVKIALLLLFISGVIVFQNRQESQLREFYMNAENVKEELEDNIQSGIEAVQYLNASAQLILDNKENMTLKLAPLVKEYNVKGDYNSDYVFDKNVANCDKANITGYGGLKKDYSMLQEMEMSLHLIRYFKLIKEQNRNFAWVYYYSNKDFVTLYPFSDPKVFELLPEYKQQPMFQYATPKMNPNKELFFTPLYIDNGGFGLMVTLGMPLYDKDKFLGATEIDITLESQSEMLKRLDHLDYHSVIINKENEVIGINNIAKPDTKDILKIDTLIDTKLLNLEDTQERLSLIDGKYVYSKNFTNAPWKFIYYEHRYEVMLKSFFYTIPLLLAMAFIVYFNKAFQRVRALSIKLKEEVMHRKVQEEQLQKTKVKLGAVISTIPDLIWVKDENGVFVMCNTAFENFFGKPAEEIIGKSDYDFVPKEQADFFLQKDREVIASGKPSINEEKISSGDNGKYIISETRKIPVYNNSEFMGVLGIGHDITERKIQEEQLHQTKEEFRSLAENTPDNIIRLDKNGCYLYINPVHERILGKPLCEVIGTSIPDSHTEVLAAIKELIETGESVLVRQEILSKKGEIEFHNVKFVPERDGSGNIISILGIGRDMTDIYRLQDDLMNKEKQFRSITENSPDVIIRYNREGRRIYINPMGEKIFGIPSDKILGKTPLDGSVLPSNLMFMERLRTVVKTGIPFEFVSEFTTSTKEQKWGHIRILPEFDSNAKVISVLTIGRDITEHKKNEDLFKLKQSRLAQLGEMISMIAHQWRQPLGAISTTAGSLELKIDLQDFDLDTKEGQAAQNLYFKERLKKIRGFVENLTTTIDDFRTFYKPNKKSVTLNYESIITKVMGIMRSSLTNDNIELSYNYNSHEEMEMYDSEMMQVVLNIFKNAQDNFKEKEIKNPKITITTLDNTLTICDNGGGIADEILEKIFDPYFSTKSEKNGTGLGLYMSKTIIEEHHNGTLSAENVDEGVCFKINLTKEIE